MLLGAKDCATLAAYLDGLNHEGRVAASRRIARADYARLFAAVRGLVPLAPDDLVPATLAPGVAVTHEGVNNLVAARTFCKVMYRQASGTIAGYNAQRWAWVTGPGYFTVYPGDAHDVVVDYTRLPQQAPPHWPLITSNRRGFAYFVYRDMVDTLRRVSRHVVVGHAVRAGRSLPNYFILVRDDRPGVTPQEA